MMMGLEDIIGGRTLFLDGIAKFNHVFATIDNMAFSPQFDSYAPQNMMAPPIFDNYGPAFEINDYIAPPPSINSGFNSGPAYAYDHLAPANDLNLNQGTMDCMLNQHFQDFGTTGGTPDLISAWTLNNPDMSYEQKNDFMPSYNHSLDFFENKLDPTPLYNNFDLDTPKFDNFTFTPIDNPSLLLSPIANDYNIPYINDNFKTTFDDFLPEHNIVPPWEGSLEIPNFYENSLLLDEFNNDSIIPQIEPNKFDFLDPYINSWRDQVFDDFSFQKDELSYKPNLFDNDFLGPSIINKYDPIDEQINIAGYELKPIGMLNDDFRIDKPSVNNDFFDSGLVDPVDKLDFNSNMFNSSFDIPKLSEPNFSVIEDTSSLYNPFIDTSYNFLDKNLRNDLEMNTFSLPNNNFIIPDINTFNGALNNSLNPVGFQPYFKVDAGTDFDYLRPLDFQPKTFDLDLLNPLADKWYEAVGIDYDSIIPQIEPNKFDFLDPHINSWRDQAFNNSTLSGFEAGYLGKPCNIDLGLSSFNIDYFDDIPNSYLLGDYDRHDPIFNNLCSDINPIAPIFESNSTDLDFNYDSFNNFDLKHNFSSLPKNYDFKLSSFKNDYFDDSLLGPYNTKFMNLHNDLKEAGSNIGVDLNLNIDGYPKAFKKFLRDEGINGLDYVYDTVSHLINNDLEPIKENAKYFDINSGILTNGIHINPVIDSASYGFFNPLDNNTELNLHMDVSFGAPEKLSKEVLFNTVLPHESSHSEVINYFGHSKDIIDFPIETDYRDILKDSNLNNDHIEQIQNSYRNHIMHSIGIPIDEVFADDNALYKLPDSLADNYKEGYMESRYEPMFELGPGHFISRLHNDPLELNHAIQEIATGSKIGTSIPDDVYYRAFDHLGYGDYINGTFYPTTEKGNQIVSLIDDLKNITSFNSLSPSEGQMLYRDLAEKFILLHGTGNNYYDKLISGMRVYEEPMRNYFDLMIRDELRRNHDGL